MVDAAAPASSTERTLIREAASPQGDCSDAPRTHEESLGRKRVSIEQAQVWWKIALPDRIVQSLKAWISYLAMIRTQSNKQSAKRKND